MSEHDLFIVFEVIVALIELFTIYIYQTGCFQFKNISVWKRIGVYMGFGLVLAFFSAFYPNMVLLPIVTFAGVFTIFVLLYKGNMLAHFFTALLFLSIGIAMEFLVSGIYSSSWGIALIRLHSYGIERIWGALTTKLLTLVVIKIVTIIMGKHRLSLPQKMWRIIPLLLCQAILIVIMTSSFINTYNTYGMLANIVGFEIIGVVFVSIVLFWYYDNLVVTYELKHRDEIITLQLENQMKYYDMVQAQQEALSGIEHDMKKHIAVLEHLIDAGHMGDASKYIASFSDSVSDNMNLVLTPHPVISAILSNCRQRAKKAEIDVQFDISIPTTLGVSDVDLTIILGNTIDNALEALNRLSAGKEKHLSVILKQSDYFLFYEVINTFEPRAKKENGYNKSHHGYGLKNVEMAVEKYGGRLIMKDGAGKYIVTIMINSPFQR